MDEYKIDRMTSRELDIALNWAAAEGWNPGIYDGNCFYSADERGYLAGRLNDRMIASISAVRYGKSFSFIGFYIVHPEYRGQGYGWQIWKSALAGLAGITAGLDGVVSQIPNYQKSGFKLAHNNIRYQGISTKENSTWPGIMPLANIPFKAVCEYDHKYFPDERQLFLQNWISQPGTIALGIIQQDILGYGCLRPCRNGYKAGPLFAENYEIAEHLLSALQSTIPPGTEFFLDIPEPNASARNLVENFQMKPVFETARMYLGKDPELPLSGIYGITSFELG